MNRSEWGQLEGKYIAAQQGKPMPEENVWRIDVIRLLAAIVEEVWKLRNKQ